MVAECGALHSLFVDPTSRSAGAKGNQTGSKAKLDPVGLVLNRRLSPTGGHKMS